MIFQKDCGTAPNFIYLFFGGGGVYIFRQDETYCRNKLSWKLWNGPFSCIRDLTGLIKLQTDRESRDTCYQFVKQE